MKETVLIDEREIVNTFIRLATKANEDLIDAMEEKHREMGIHPHSYVGGLECIIYDANMPIESLIKNLFAVYNNNFQNSIFFQLDNLKKMQTLSMVKKYLREKGIEEDFLRWRYEKENSSKGSIKKSLDEGKR